MNQKKISVKPCGHYVLVEPEIIDAVSEGGIILNKDMVNRENTAKVRGTIVAIGANAWKDYGGEPWAEVGDKVWFKRHVSDKIEDDNDIDEHGEKKLYFLLNDNDILAIRDE